MRKVEKPIVSDLKLKDFKDFDKFLVGADAHKTHIQHNPTDRKIDDQTYSFAKAALSHLYHNKCAFCEQFLTDNKNRPNSFTIEHYRPKNKMLYFWLGAEWTNLFPTCADCQKRAGKSDWFEILNEKCKKPFDTANNFDAMLFDAVRLNMLENPLLLHPEIDDPKLFFECDKNGAIQAKDKTNQRANETIRILGLNNDFDKIEKTSFQRKKIIDGIKPDLLTQYQIVVKNYKYDEIDDRILSVAFDAIFRKVINQADTKAEFSFLGCCLVLNFDALIAKPLAEENRSDLMFNYLNQSFLKFCATLA